MALTIINFTPDQWEKILEEFNTTSNDFNNDIEMLKKWLQKQPHLPNITDNDYLTSTLLRCKNSLEKSKYVLERYLTLKANMPDVYTGWDPTNPQLERVMKMYACVPLPQLTNEGDRLLFLRCLDSSAPVSEIVSDMLKVVFMTNDFCMKIDKSRSYITVIDHDGMNLSMIPTLVANFKKFIHCEIDGLPMRFRQTYLLNSFPGTQIFLTLAKTMMRKKLFDKIKILNSIEELHNQVPLHCLPNDYGGTAESTLAEFNDKWIKTCQMHKDWILEQEYVKADNSKRIKTTIFSSDGTSFEGSFRKLNID